MVDHQTEAFWDRMLELIRSEVMASYHPTGSPPPSAMAAEACLVSAALSVDVSRLEVSGEHFFSELLGTVYDMAGTLRDGGADVSLPPIVAALRDQGVVGPVERELVRLRDAVPTVSWRELEGLAAEVVELHKRRRLLARLVKLEAELRSGACSASEAVERLSTVAHRG